jgi:hypothetical protein
MSGIPAGAGALLGKRLGKFDILALLALGGTAEIYLARIGGAAGFEKYVVVKCLHDHLADDTEFVKMFLDEARLAAYLDHSNIVQTMELGEHENRYYMVMEFLAGLSLAMIVRRCAERMPNGRLPVPLALNMIAQTCAGLHYAHERAANGKPLNIVHRDISPQNLVVSFEGIVKIVDFGIAKAEMRETRTRSGTIKGKFAYMSPEQCVANNVDRRTDVFAAGVIAHELLTGRRLFKRPSPYETYQSVIECNVQPPSQIDPEIDPALDEVILRAVAKDKEARYPTAEAFGDAILSYLHHHGKSSGPGDVSRFFDASFAQEIDEHGARMRELIAGRDFSVDTGTSWGDEEDEAKKAATVDFRKPRSDDSAEPLGTGDLEDVDRASLSGELSDVISDLGASRSEDDELPAEKTRIEANPLDKVNELERELAQQQQQQQRPMMPPSGALPLPPVPTGPVPAAGASSSFAEVPTVIATPEPDHAPELAATALGPAVDPVGRTMADPNRPMLPPQMPPQPMMQPPMMQPPNGTPGGMPPQQPLQHHPAMGTPGGGLNQPQLRPPPGYPQMSPQLGAQMSPQLQAKLNVPNRPPLPDSGQQASLMSPVGQHYPQDVDWAAAAAKPVRVLPPWMLALVFVGALGVALGLTIAIASAFR